MAETKNESPFMHPTGNIPNRVNIVALGPTNATFHKMHFMHEPIVPEADETWCVNTGLRTQKADVVFVMDDLVGMANKYPRYGKDLINCKIPIITGEYDNYITGNFPSAVKYPLQEIINKFGLVNAYFHNSVPYILAYALFIGVQHIHMFGSDYSFDGINVREDDRANAEYWIGFIRGWSRALNLDMDIMFTPDTTICSVDKGLWFYGFARQPVITKND